MKQNKSKVALFLPFLQTVTGHHHVADVLIQELKNCNKQWTCEKVDILSYSFGQLERVVTSTYLAWIKFFPDVYHWLYLHKAYKKSSKRTRNYVYESLFSYFFRRLIAEKNPAILFCTHALPSNIASTLKQKRELNAIIINVYTDYFVNRIWGIDGIDYHFVPSITVKEFLLKLGVKEECIFLTGIPVHPAFMKSENIYEKERAISILVTGGTLGIGKMKQLLSNANSEIHYHVLCGKNEKLYKELLNEKKTNIIPYPYISCNERMNDLYNQVDGVLTKPGGVTISECLMKRKPIFLYEALPAQEKINADQLKQLGLVISINMQDSSVEKQILLYFSNKDQQKHYQDNIDVFHQHLDVMPLNTISDQLINDPQTS